jgi:hypothetical protein
MIEPNSPDMARIKTFLAQLRGLDDMLFGKDATPGFHDIGMGLYHMRLLTHDLEFYSDQAYSDYERQVLEDVTLQNTSRTPIPDFLKNM